MKRGENHVAGARELFCNSTLRTNPDDIRPTVFRQDKTPLCRKNRPFLTRFFLSCLGATWLACSPVCSSEALSLKDTLTEELPNGKATSARYRNQVVYYATNRAPRSTIVRAGEQLLQFSSDPETTTNSPKRVHWGRSKVTVPKGRVFGEFNFKAPETTDYEDTSDKNNYIIINRTQDMTANTFTESVSEELPSDCDIIVYVPGYNNTFYSGLGRAAQLAQDIGNRAPIFTFSWPAGDSALDIMQDIQNAEGAEPQLLEFLKVLADSLGPGRKIHIIAHSLGARLVLNALHQASGSYNYGRLAAGLGQLIIANPFTDVTQMKLVATDLRGIVQRITVFCASDDEPLSTAAQSYRQKIIGRCEGIEELSIYDNNPPYYYSPRKVPIDVIDITNSIKCSYWWFLKISCSHSRFFYSPLILQDVSRIINTDEKFKHPINRGGIYEWKVPSRLNSGLMFLPKS